VARDQWPVIREQKREADPRVARDDCEWTGEEKDDAEMRSTRRLRREEVDSARVGEKRQQSCRTPQGVLSAGRRRVIFSCRPGVAELADAPDSKSGGRKAVWVRPPPPGPFFIFLQIFETRQNRLPLAYS
jgi:hypothetical protein